MGTQGCRRADNEGENGLSNGTIRRGWRPRPLSASVGCGVGAVGLVCWLNCLECVRWCDGEGVVERLLEGEDLWVAREVLPARLPEELEISARGV